MSGLYEDATEVGRRIKTREDIEFPNGSIVPAGSFGTIIRVEPAGNFIVYVALMDDDSERAFERSQFVLIKKCRNSDVTEYDPEIDEPAYASEDVIESDFTGNRGRRRHRRHARSNPDEEIRLLERRALAGDAAAIRRLAARASHAPPEGIILRPQPTKTGARNVRNFWITLNVDGEATTVATGPSGADGGFSLSILMRDHGGAVEAMRVAGFVIEDELTLTIDGKTALTTER